MDESLRTKLRSKTVAELKAILKERQMDVRGKKDELVERLVLDETEKSGDPNRSSLDTDPLDSSQNESANIVEDEEDDVSIIETDIPQNSTKPEGEESIIGTTSQNQNASIPDDDACVVESETVEDNKIDEVPNVSAVLDANVTAGNGNQEDSVSDTKQCEGNEIDSKVDDLAMAETVSYSFTNESHVTSENQEDKTEVSMMVDLPADEEDALLAEEVEEEILGDIDAASKTDDKLPAEIPAAGSNDEMKAEVVAQNDNTSVQCQKKVAESRDQEEVDISSADEDADQDALRLTIGDEEANFLAASDKEDDEDREVGAANKRNRSNGNERSSGADKDQVKKLTKDDDIAIVAVKKNSTGSKGQQCSSTASKETKIAKGEDNEGSNDGKQKDGHILTVNGLCPKCTASDIKTIMQTHGKIVGVKVISNTKASGSRRFAQVEMGSEDDIKKAISNEFTIHGHKLTAEKAAIDRSPAKNSSKSDHQTSATSTSNTDNNSHGKKSDESRKNNSSTNTTSSKDKGHVSSKEKDKGHSHKEGTKSKDNTNKDGTDKDKSKEKAKDHHSKTEKDKHTAGKDGKKETDKRKNKSSDTAEVANKTGSGGNKKGSDERKGDPRKDTRSVYIDRHRFNASRPGGYHRENESSSGGPYRSGTFTRPGHSGPTSYGYRGRGGRVPPPAVSSRPCLTFDKIREHRERERIRENERKIRERERRRREEEEKQRIIEKRNREEFQILEREREKLRMEREKVERDKMELIRLERERQRTERERIEKEREELRRAQLKIEEHRRVLKRPLPEEKEYQERKKPAIADVRRYEGAGRSDDYTYNEYGDRYKAPSERSRHEAKDLRMNVDSNRDPRLDREHPPRPAVRDYPSVASRSASVRHLDTDKDWLDQSREVARIEPKKISHRDEPRDARVRGRDPMPSDYDSLYRPSAPAPPSMKTADRYSDHKEYGFSGRTEWERKSSNLSSMTSQVGAPIPSHSSTQRSSWPDRKSDSSWPSSDKLSMSDRWASPSASSMSAPVGARSGTGTLPSLVGPPAASNYTYPSPASASSGFGRSGQSYSSGSGDFVYKFRRF